MSNFNYGQDHLFWELLILAVEDVDQIDEKDRTLHIISPWIRDISLFSCGVPPDEWRALFGGYTGRLSKLSDVLLLMKKELGFEIHIKLLDSADKLLASSHRPFLEEEVRFVDRIVCDRTNPEVKVWKKIGGHAKMYVFPHGCLTGSTNLTNAGLFLNGENMSLTMKDESPVEYAQIAENAVAHLAGSDPYFADTTDRFQIESRPPTVPGEDFDDETEGPEIEDPGFKFPDTVKDREDYPIPLEIGLGEIPNTGDQFLNSEECNALTREIKAFEVEMRRFLKNYYWDAGNDMSAWQEAIEDGQMSFIALNSEYVCMNCSHKWRDGKSSECPMCGPDEEVEIEKVPVNITVPPTYKNKLGSNWHRLFVALPDGTTMHEKASKEFSKGLPNYEEYDFEGGVIPDPSDLSVDVMLNYAFYIDDIWTCIYGTPIRPFFDYAGTELTDKSLIRFTRLALLNKGIGEDAIRRFWIKLEDAFRSIKGARNTLDHSKPLARVRAINCQNGLLLFHQRVLKPFDAYVTRRG